jgi:MFS transporter, PPP family, 3-phenylpropionic acid transporter
MHDQPRSAIRLIPPGPKIRTGEGFAPRLAVFYGASCAAIGVQMPFLPVWLAAKELDSRLIGLVLAVPMLVRIATIPVVTGLADRHDCLRAGIVLAAAASVLGYGALGLADGVVAISTLFALASVAYTPLMPLTDAYALRGLAQRGRAYGPVRLWGSVTFIVGSFGAGVLLDLTAPRDLIWLVVAAMLPTAVVALVLRPLDTPAAKPAARRSPIELLRDPAFLAVIAAASLIQASHAMYYGFSTLGWRAAGLDGKVVGALWAVGVLAEIILFSVSGRLPAALSPTLLLRVGALGAVIRWSAMAFGPPAAVLPLLQCLHGLSFGATHLGTLGFIAQTTPVGLAARAQGYVAVALGLVMAGAMSLSGVLYGRYGAAGYAAMAVIAGAGGLCALAAHRHARPSAAV